MVEHVVADHDVEALRSEGELLADRRCESHLATSLQSAESLTVVDGLRVDAVALPVAVEEDGAMSAGAQLEHAPEPGTWQKRLKGGEHLPRVIPESLDEIALAAS